VVVAVVIKAVVEGEAGLWQQFRLATVMAGTEVILNGYDPHQSLSSTANCYIIIVKTPFEILVWTKLWWMKKHRIQ
ncbi:MAG: hypothetical protein ACI90V_009046, partial [Bacillariaceae sp.]|jgi:hypothetical protein